MCYSVRHCLGYGYGLVQGHVPSGPQVLSCQRQGGKVHMLRAQDQAKHAGREVKAHFILT
jgi:hypothetical protein